MACSVACRGDVSISSTNVEKILDTAGLAARATSTYFPGATISVIRPTLVSPVNRLPRESMAM